jgi:Right handed beta helix region
MRRIAPIVLASVLLASAGASAATIVVTNTNDVGPGSLRQAILDANDRGGADIITFDIPGPGPFVITVASSLPPFDASGGITVDGTTQPGYAVRPLIGTGGTVGVDQLALAQIRSPIVQIFGNGLAGTGLLFTANASTLRGLHVWGFTGINVALTDANDAEVVQNLIGANAAFGDPGPGLRAGINLLFDRVNSPRVRNNLVAYASGSENVLVTDQGGQILVEGNELVGSLRFSSESPLGSPLATPNRFISGNLIRDSVSYGMDIIGGQSQLTISNNTVRNNGTGGVNPAGIRLTDAANDTTKNNVLVRNIVTGNQGPGILITGAPGGANQGNTITRNSIFLNGGIGIDLGGESSDPLTGDGQTLNDPADADTGGNDLFNFPVIESATISGSSLIVTGWSGNKTTIEFFADPAGSQGRTFIASLDEGSARQRLYDQLLRARSHQWCQPGHRRYTALSLHHPAAPWSPGRERAHRHSDRTFRRQHVGVRRRSGADHVRC